VRVCVEGAVEILVLSKGSVMTGNVSVLKLIEGRPSAVRCDAIGGYPPPVIDLFVGMIDVTRYFTARYEYAIHAAPHHTAGDHRVDAHYNTHNSRFTALCP